eukprot:4704931-Prymnesium_polylepis.1
MACSTTKLLGFTLRSCPSASPPMPSNLMATRPLLSLNDSTTPRCPLKSGRETRPWASTRAPTASIASFSAELSCRCRSRAHPGSKALSVSAISAVSSTSWRSRSRARSRRARSHASA